MKVTASLLSWGLSHHEENILTKQYNLLTMNNIKLFRLAVCFAILVGLFSNPVSVHACSCAPIGNPDEAFTKTDAVFIGRVVKTTDVSGIVHNFLTWAVHKLEISPVDYFKYVYRFRGIDVTFKVTKSWKLVNTTSIKIRTGYGEADCGYSFEVDKEYLVYANYINDEPGSYLYSGFCSRTSQTSNARDCFAA